MSHNLKLGLTILRFYFKPEEDIRDKHMGFRNVLGTMEALFGVTLMTQRRLDMN